jgi:hypothetical protein
MEGSRMAAYIALQQSQEPQPEIVEEAPEPNPSGD